VGTVAYHKRHLELSSRMTRHPPARLADSAFFCPASIPFLHPQATVIRNKERTTQT
jgi:hypothetical protein